MLRPVNYQKNITSFFFPDIRQEEPIDSSPCSPLSIKVEEDEVEVKEEPISAKPRRFVSSILGGSIPYGSRDHILEKVIREQISPIPTPEKLVIPTKERKEIPETVPAPENLAPIRRTVIQRLLKTTKRDEDKKANIPAHLVTQEPEQEEPINYHIPKRTGETENDSEEKKSKDQRSCHCNTSETHAVSLRTAPDKIPTMNAAAGHGRGNSSGQNGGSSNHSSGNSGGGGSNTINFGGGSSLSGSGGGGSMCGGSGNGGMNPGRDGRQNYGPSSPPTGSLPPFYETLKGGNNSKSYNANNCNQLNLVLGLDSETNDFANLNVSGINTSPKQYSMLQNASYGIVMKDESDFDTYDSKVDAMGNIYSTYDDISDMVAGGVIDPLQLSATLTFASGSDSSLLDTLSDANDLTTFLQRLPQEDNDNEEILPPSSMHTPPITPPDSQMHGVDHNLDFTDQVFSRNYDSRIYPQFGKLYQDSLPIYQSAVNPELQMQLQHQILSPPLSFNGSALDLDSPTSLPSPGGESHNDGGSLSPPMSISGRRDSTGPDSPTLIRRVNILQQKVVRTFQLCLLEFFLTI